MICECVNVCASLKIYPFLDFFWIVYIDVLLIGDMVQVVYDGGTGTTPLLTSLSYYYNGFIGFKI